ncbi:mandelate racemase/muconate lactonizing enzyme family protein [Halosimplex halobium]|uniref:mandelate racemase/muconate lactonizing enzyme family protein n=1 Tax=Halosimplex halobium TaxID=3396618 RepID=UPI003F5433D0
MVDAPSGTASVRDVETRLYRVPNEESLEDATQSFDTLEVVALLARDDEGREGLGFTYTIGRGGPAIQRFLDDEIAPRLEGHPVAPRSVRSTMRESTTFVGREGISEFAVAAADIAAWDLLGKETGQPLYALLGGSRRSVDMYETDGGWLQYDAEELVANAETVAADGFAGMKMKVGSSVDRDIERVSAVRETLPDELDLMLDANCSYTVPEARRLASRIEGLDVTWLEEPLPKGDYAAYADLRRRVDVPIATGENFYNETQFRQVLSRDAVDFLQPDVCRVGGVTPWLRVAELAANSGVAVSPHYIEPLHAHLAALYDNVPYIEHHSTVLDELVEEPLTPDDGRVTPPDRPGHGISFDGDRYLVSEGS